MSRFWEHIKANGREDMYSGSVRASEKEAWRHFAQRTVTVERVEDSALRKGLRCKKKWIAGSMDKHKL
jgi:hypothetical protein